MNMIPDDPYTGLTLFMSVIQTKMRLSSKDEAHSVQPIAVFYVLKCSSRRDMTHSHGVV
jgi:hypothetical protein